MKKEYQTPQIEWIRLKSCVIKTSAGIIGETPVVVTNPDGYPAGEYYYYPSTGKYEPVD